jgi:hypothetical protein
MDRTRLSAGKSKKLTLRLNARGRRLLTRQDRLKLKLLVLESGLAVNSRSVTVRP